MRYGGRGKQGVVMALKMHSLYMDPADIAEIKRIAHKKDISFARAVRDAIRLYLEKEGGGK
jgi:hypothetical protein